MVGWLCRWLIDFPCAVDEKLQRSLERSPDLSLINPGGSKAVGGKPDCFVERVQKCVLRAKLLFFGFDWFKHMSSPYPLSFVRLPAYIVEFTELIEVKNAR